MHVTGTPIPTLLLADVNRLRGRMPVLLAGLLLVASLGGCACRPGFVGPYGGVHPPRCWIW